MPQDTISYVFDGQTTFVGGQDASKTPEYVPENAYFSGINTTCKNGAIGPRDGFNRLPLVFPDEGLSIGGKTPYKYENLFRQGKYQASIPYFIGSQPFMLVVVSGLIYGINLSTFSVTPIPISDGSRINEFSRRVNWSFASRYVVIFDFPSFPVIIENLTARRADPADNEVPISVLGCYNQNRLFIGNAGNEFTGGDPTGSLAAPDAPITFLEIETPGSPFFGEIFQLPTDYNNPPITAMTFLQLVDTSTGIGPLIVATRDQVFAFRTDQPRTGWSLDSSGNSVVNQFGSCIVNNAGIAGPRSFTNVNSDLFFISIDGQIRTLSMSRDEQGKWSKVPLSREVRNWLKYRDKSLVPLATMAYFNNNIFATANPYRVTARTLDQDPISDYAFGGLVVLETDNISTLREESPPVWAGLWTGIRPMDFCTVGTRCFVISKDEESINHIWEITPDVTVDKADYKERYIRSVFYTRNFDFQDEFKNKELLYLDTHFDNVRGDFKVKVDFRPAHGPYFLPWGTFNHIAPYRFCDITDPNCNFNGFMPQAFRQIKFGAPDTDACDPVTKEFYKMFREVQLKFTIEGRTWELPHYKLAAVGLPQSDTDVTVCEPYNKVALCGACDTDWEIPPFGECTEKET